MGMLRGIIADAGAGNFPAIWFCTSAVLLIVGLCVAGMVYLIRPGC